MVIYKARARKKTCKATRRLPKVSKTFCKVKKVQTCIKGVLFKQQSFLSKSLSCDRASRAYMKFEHQISEGTYHT